MTEGGGQVMLNAHEKEKQKMKNQLNPAIIYRFNCVAFSGFHFP